MSKDYYITDKDKALALAYGIQPVRADLVRSEKVAVGTDLQVTLQQALGKSPWDACIKLGYGSDAIQDIPSSNFRFFGEPGDPSDYFPADVPHPGAAYIDVRLPIGVASDADPDKLIGNYRCLIVSDYDENGNEIDFSFSANPARVAMDVIKRVRPRMIDRNLIDWEAWCEWRDWCAQLISVTVDGETVQIPRFEAHIFIIPPFNLGQIISRICQITCSEFQWRGGKLRFMAPIDRDPVFTFNLAQVHPDAKEFKFIPIDSRKRPNGVKIIWRNLLDPYLKEEDAFIVKRDELIAKDGGLKNYLEINVGTAHPSQVERTAHFWARARCDMTDTVKIPAAWKSYPVLPGDDVLLTHDVPDWTDKKAFVIQKEEDEDNGKGYPYALQIRPVNPYSDTDHSPAATPTAPDSPNPFAAPPAAELTLSASTFTQNDGTKKISVLGTVAFGDFGFPQTGKIYHLKPSGSYERLDELTPDASNQATFRAYNLESGTHWFKVITVSELNVVQTAVGGDNEKSITINGADFVINDVLIRPAAERTYIGLGPSGDYRGQDTDIVPLSVITAKVIKSVPYDNGENVDVNITGQILGARTNPAAQGFSVFQSKVEVFNKFGESVIQFVPDGFTGAGTLGKGTFPRKYADPLEEAFFKIEVRNYFGWSDSKYLQGATLLDASPVPVPITDKSAYPRELSGSALSATTIRISFQFSGTASLYRRKVGQGVNDWVVHQSGITASPYDAGNFPEYADYELQLWSDADNTKRSNIIRVKTKPQGEGAPTRPAPTGASGARDVSDPQHVLNFSCVSAANVETEVFVNGSFAELLDAVAVGGTITYQISSLSPGDSRSVKFRHKFATDDYSVSFSEEITISTQGTTPSGTAPYLSSGAYQSAYGRVKVNVTPGSGTGNYQVKRSLESATTGYDEYYDSLSPASATAYYDYGVTADDFGFYIWYKMVQFDVGIESDPVQVWIPPVDLYGPCFTGDTLILMADFSLKRIDEIQKDDWVMGFDLGGNFHPARVTRTQRHSVREHLKVYFEGRKTARKVTREHPYWLPNGLFLPIGNIAEGEAVQIRKAEIWMPRMIEKKETICCLNEYGVEFIDVYNLNTTLNTFIVVDEETGEEEGVHNSKA